MIRIFKSVYEVPFGFEGKLIMVKTNHQFIRDVVDYSHGYLLMKNIDNKINIEEQNGDVESFNG